MAIPPFLNPGDFSAVPRVAVCGGSTVCSNLPEIVVLLSTSSINMTAVINISSFWNFLWQSMLNVGSLVAHTTDPPGQG